MTLDESFPHRYRVERITPVESSQDVCYFPARPALSVEVVPAVGGRWTGVFGEDEGVFPTGLFTTPHEDVLCVVCGGAGYFVHTEEPPSRWTAVGCAPIRIVLPFPNQRLLVFGDFTRFVAYKLAPDYPTVYLEVAWKSDRLGWDDLEVLETSDGRIEGRAWNAPEDRMIGFSVDVVTGEHEGGAYPRPR
jgi:hypothetical protein